MNYIKELQQEIVYLENQINMLNLTFWKQINTIDIKCDNKDGNMRLNKDTDMLVIHAGLKAMIDEAMKLLKETKEELIEEDKTY